MVLVGGVAQWLADAHTALDAAVASAHGWDQGICQDEALANLLEYNLRARQSTPLHVRRLRHV